MANFEDFGVGVVVTPPSPATSGTSVTLRAGDGANFPAAPFYGTFAPAGQLSTKGNSEKVLVTAKSTDTLTITRAQGGTTAKSIDVDWIFVNAIYKDDIYNSSLISNEVPSGTINGSNTAFTTASAFSTSSLRVFLNGVRLKLTDDYTVSGQTITFVTAPPTGSNLLVDYMVGNSANSVGTNSIIVGEVPAGTVNGSNATFTTARAYIAGSLEVMINGVVQARTTHFAETTPGSGIFTMGDAPLTGDIITVNYQFNLNPSSNADTVDGQHANDLSPVGTILPYAPLVVPTGNWQFAYGQAISRSSYGELFAALVPSLGAFTVTIASPAVVTLTAHGMATGDPVYLTTTSALPTGLSANTIYYTVFTDANTFGLATSYANAIAGTRINTSGSQSGTHTMNRCPYGLGDGSTTFNVPDMRGRVVAGQDDMGGTSANRLTNPSTTTGGVNGDVLGIAGGEETHTQSWTEVAEHWHITPVTSSASGYPDANGVLIGSAGADRSAASRSVANTGTGANVSSLRGVPVGANVVQPTIILNYIIKVA